MATWDEIKILRLAINDPADVIDIVAVANSAALPATPAQQTAYYVQDIEHYVSTELESDVVEGDYSQLELLLSDSFVESLIDTYGASKAVCRAYKTITSRLGSKLRLQSTSSGAESSSYTALRDMYDYYKNLSKDCEEVLDEDEHNAAGRFGKMHQPRIAGGNV